ncbi:MAG: DUF6056 family protein, partial [Candidatus Symbiothrix sp.]|nr:DUF6056 family protein [Candidatus Symbiothrix sp.]
KRITALLFVVVNILLWFLVPAWGENFLWLSGSCNYLWMITIALLFLIPFRTKMSNPEYKPSWGLSCLYLILGFLSGLSIENLSAAVGVFLGVYFVVKMIKKERFTPFEVLGCLGFMAGFCVLISAPGNYVRMAFSSMLTLFDRVWKLNTGFFSFSNALLTVLVIFIAFDLIFHQKKKLNGYIWAYFIAGCASIFSMIFAPYANERTYVFAIVFISIMLLNLLIYTPLPAIIKRNFFIILIIYAVSFAVAGRSIVGTYFKWEKRTQYILSQKEKGIKDIEIKTAIEAFNSHNAYSNFGDILDIGDQWNQITAKYYGVNSIKRVENDEVW